MHLCLLTTLLALTVSKGVTISSTFKPTSPPTPNAEHHSTSATATKTDVTSPSAKSAHTERPRDTSAQITTQLTPSPGSPSAPPSTSRQTNEPTTTSTPQTTPTGQTFSQKPTLLTTSLNASSAPINTTSSALSPEWSQGDLAANPGLVAILCIFCIILALVLVVATVKCIRSPRSNFERLDDVPMGKVNEESPFAQHSK